MTSPEARATVILIDNSPSSMNGDFYPTRLDAQKECISKIATLFFSDNPNSQVGVITMSKPEFGIRSSLTSVMDRVQKTLPIISRGKEPIDIEKAIKCGLMALKNCTLADADKRILLMVGSKHFLTPANAQELRTLIKSSNAMIDIVTFGRDIQNADILDELGWIGCTKLEIIRPSIQLFDYILASPICAAKIQSPAITQKLSKTDPELYEALTASASKRDNPHFVAISSLMEKRAKTRARTKTPAAEQGSDTSQSKKVNSGKKKK